MKKTKLIAPIITAVLFALLLTFQSTFAALIPTPIALYEDTLAGQISATDTSFNIVRGTDKTGRALASSTYSFIIDEGTASEEMVIANCTSTACTGAIRGIDVLYGSSTTSSLRKIHRRGAEVKMTDGPLLIIIARILNGAELVPNKLTYGPTAPSITSGNDVPNATYVQTWSASSTDYVNSNFFKNSSNNTATGDNSFSGSNTFATTSIGGTVGVTGVATFTVPPVSSTICTANTEVCNKAYIDGVSIAGGSNANNTTTGLVRVATSTQYSKGFASTTLYYALTSDSASSTASSTNSIIVATGASTGKIDPSFLNGSSESYTLNGITTLASTTINGTTTYGGYPLYGNFGGGSDGDLTIAGGATTTLSRDTYYNNLVVNGGLVTGGYSVFVKGTLSGTGNITWGTPTAGTAGVPGVNCSGGAGGAGGTTSGGKFATCAGGSGGGSGAVGVASVAQASSIATTTGGTGGSASGAGGAGGAVTLGTKFGVISSITMTGQDITSTSSYVFIKSGSGGGGGAGGGANGGCGGGGGGGGGASGGVVMVYARNWTGTFSMVSVGGAGGAGASAFNGDGGGGGGGGTGGSVATVFEYKTWTGTYNVAGGALGAGAAGSAGKNAGNNGVAGGTGAVFEINIRSLLR